MYDLLNNKKKLRVLEDHKNQVQVVDIVHFNNQQKQNNNNNTNTKEEKTYFLSYNYI